MLCVEVHGVVFCCSVRAGGVLFKTRTQYLGVLGKKHYPSEVSQYCVGFKYWEERLGDECCVRIKFRVRLRSSSRSRIRSRSIHKFELDFELELEIIRI